MKRIFQKEKAGCIIFYLSLLSLWAADLMCPDRLYSDWEKRLLAQKPEASLAAVSDGSYGQAYETWLTDQFPQRDWWVSVKTRCELLLGKKEVDGIYLGKDGYLFSEQEKTTDWDILEEQMKVRFGEERVSRIRVPSAGEILTDKVPSGITFFQEGESSAQTVEALSRHKDEYIYYRTDHHWTMLGAYYAYEAWMKAQGCEPVPLARMKKQVLKEDFFGTHYGRLHYAKYADVMEFYDPGVACSAVYDLGKTDVSGLYQEKYLETADAYRFFLDGNHGLVQIESGQKGGHLAVLKDSFANCMIPFLTAHYGKITVIDPRYFRTDIGAWLKEQEPDQILILSQNTVYSSMCSSP
ncbi:MAG TPA: hypothetical protein DD414_01085 [Lachnospiraceae bacterium]|nr:hypothetical protein [Lachnospiraceae bacterium]